MRGPLNFSPVVACAWPVRILISRNRQSPLIRILRAVPEWLLIHGWVWSVSFALCSYTMPHHIIIKVRWSASADFGIFLDGTPPFLLHVLILLMIPRLHSLGIFESQDSMRLVLFYRASQVFIHIHVQKSLPQGFNQKFSAVYGSRVAPIWFNRSGGTLLLSACQRRFRVNTTLQT